MKSNNRLPLEERTRIESEKHFAQWSSGSFQFLLQRTESYYNRTKVKSRRKKAERALNCTLEMISDKLLLGLYRLALKKHQAICNTKYDNSGYQRTPSESTLLNSIETVIKKNSILKYLEIYPSMTRSKDIFPNMKMLIGIHVPDFLIFGVKANGFSSVAIEVDGDSHFEKYSKDMKRYENLAECKVMTLSIPNEKAGDLTYIEKLLLDLVRARSGALDRQIKSNKRDIWTKSIACQLSLSEIEAYSKKEFGIDLHLEKEAECFLDMSDCPRSIRKELTDLKNRN